MQFPSKEQATRQHCLYPAGTRVELAQMDDVQAPPVGIRGTAISIDDTGSIAVDWDNGSRLNVIHDVDRCRKVPTDD